MAKKGNTAHKERFKKVSKWCRANSKPFTKAFGRCFKANFKNVKAGKAMTKKF